MAAGESSSAMVQQLSRQLHAVSGIAESLTLRLLALEERFAQIESALDSAADCGRRKRPLPPRRHPQGARNLHRCPLLGR